jgi:hypothetical protein
MVEVHGGGAGAFASRLLSSCSGARSAPFYTRAEWRPPPEVRATQCTVTRAKRRLPT